MKKLITIVLFVAATFNVKAQSDYLITKEGEKVAITSDASLGVTYISFYKDKKEVIYNHTEIKYVTISGRQFLTLSLMGGKMMRLQEIVCYNDKYILTSFYQGGSHLLVFDWTLTNVMPHKLMSNKFPKQKTLFNEEIKKYFKDSPILMDAFNTNINNIKPFIDGMYSLKGGSKDISTLIQSFMSGETNNGKKQGVK